MTADLDDDVLQMSREQLTAEVRRLRAGIRQHRDSSGHDLCWHHPQLWGLLPEPMPTNIAVPPWPQFLRGCLKYRESLDRELPHAPIADQEYGCSRWLWTTVVIETYVSVRAHPASVST